MPTTKKDEQKKMLLGDFEARIAEQTTILANVVARHARELGVEQDKLDLLVLQHEGLNKL